MTSITISDILTITFVLVDDSYQVVGVKLLRGKTDLVSIPFAFLQWLRFVHSQG